MRLALLSRAAFPYHPFGGMEQAVYGTACGLAELGHEVILFTANPLPGWEKRAQSAGQWPPPFQTCFLPYRLFPLGRRNSIPDRLANYPLFALRLKREISKLAGPPDLVYCQGLSGFGYALKPGHGPLVVNPQGMEELKVREKAKQIAYAPFNQILRFTARHAAAVIATDTPQISEVQQLLGVPAAKVALIPNAVDLARLDNLADEATIREMQNRFKADAEVLIVSVGRIETNKGFEVGLSALAQARLPEKWRWVIVGQGSQRSSLEKEAARLNLLNQKIFFAGSLPDRELHALYEVADFFLHPTLYEGSSLVTLEAMSHRLPIIASAAGGLPDKISSEGPNANGYLCQPGDAKALAEAVSKLAALSQAERARMGENSRAKIEQNYSWPQIALQLSDLFEKLVQS